MEFRHLRYFIAVAEELHFTRAAQRLRIAQPPLSQQIRRMEEELGVRLFHRTKRSVQLTEVGEIFLREARLVLAQAERAVWAAQRAGRGEIGRLVVGFMTSAVYNVLPGILQAFRQSFPDVNLVLNELSTPQQLQALRDRRIHIGFLRPPVDDETLSVESLLQESLIIALAENHPLSIRAHVPLRALVNEPFILFPRDQAPGLYDHIVSFCQQADFSPRVVQQAVQVQTMVSLVATGIGVALVPASVQNLRWPGVAYRSLRPRALKKVETAVAWRRDESSDVLHEFLEVVRQTMGSSRTSMNAGAWLGGRPTRL